ncbi:SMR family transporter [Candidatus Vallotia cooleyia]|uniref:SMR family transporter n=1 Tax=Candidatus Vallotiella adelgis TaxID=1177211 RepID=UPI001D00C89D|nr:SMR family transporter [Candidatus Vallotia cooleyia]UDG81933.1 4-amino-4-deoxy-L-arabinose-phosphoundecaprenol flippase subunit ArnE [Candidatus Vallotia cooleyia]
MDLISLTCILSSVILNASAQLLLKAGINAVGYFEFSVTNIVPISLRLVSQWPIIGGLACYSVSVIVWILGLSRVDVSIAYPMLSLGYIINAAVAWYLFSETISSQKLVGIAIILLGVVVLVHS